ncbi:hypothetical protein Tsubulata_029602 [Turnera subulata]|uniref:E3 ubiquitin-protein ligase RMA n=1 Tax=Turnera subulata TaxID=218843 RepID=A0A9Q0FHN1_9ROSI|nr:hypothetical protein Tsubulata_029602 [Turnera subulata]
MAEETSDTMNLDLNLGPGPEAGSEEERTDRVNLDDWISDPFERIREAVRLGAQPRWRWRHVQRPRRTESLSVDLEELIGNSGSASTLQAGEGSVAPEERTNEAPKTCENNNGFSEEAVSEGRDEVEQGSSNDGSFFDCNICFDLATDPVVTCCGHLFCWPCLYRWLHVHSDAKECPVCKGEVTTKNVTPIYGRGCNNHEPVEDSTVEIPVRPQARRVESLRQTAQRNSFGFPMEEMIRRLWSRNDLTRELSLPQESDGVREPIDRSNSYLNRFMTIRGMRAEQNPLTPAYEIVDLTRSPTTSPEAGSARRSLSLLLRRSQAHSRRTSNPSSVSSALHSADERLVDTLFRTNLTGRSQEQSQPVDDRDSFSSIAAVINSESQVDTAVEIDSMVSLSTSSRRRNDASRVSDVDSGDSRAPRRRRLN